MRKENTKQFEPTSNTMVMDETGRIKPMQIVNEFPLTIILNGMEIVTLMTLGTEPTLLVLGYLRNQRLIEKISHILSVTIDREKDAIFVEVKKDSIIDLKHKTRRKITTTGCGEGTIFSCSLNKIYDHRLEPHSISTNEIKELCRQTRRQSDIYKMAGSVHSCALCTKDEVLILVEDVGRHNAADTIAGKMWQEDISGSDKIFYTTGRITSEIVIKASLMGIPILLSRSGVTQMGLEIAQDLNMIIIGRAKASKFQVFSGQEYVNFNQAIPTFSIRLNTSEGTFWLTLISHCNNW